MSLDTVTGIRTAEFYNGLVVSEGNNLNAGDVMSIPDNTICVGKTAHTSTLLVNGEKIRGEWEPSSIGFFPNGHAATCEYEDSNAVFIYARLPEISKTWTNEKSHDPHTVYKDPVTEHLLHAISSAGIMDPLMVDHVSLALAARVHSWHLGNKDKPTGRHSKKIETAIEYVHTNIENKITLSDLSSAAAMSQYHFAREFKLHTGLAPHAFVSEKRVQRSKWLLRKSTMSIAMVALSCGFASQAHFSQAFKHHTGATPGAYRKEAAPSRKGFS